MQAVNEFRRRGAVAADAVAVADAAAVVDADAVDVAAAVAAACPGAAAACAELARYHPLNANFIRR
jgi:hypothetical protein